MSLKYFLNLHRLDALKIFLSKNPLILQEVQAKRKLEKLRALRGDRHVNVVHLKVVRSILDKIGNGNLIRREHVHDADHFPHLGNPSYILRQESVELNREVVHLQRVCWLHFCKDFRVRVASNQCELSQEIEFNHST